MGRVWLAGDEMLRREVALKELILPAGLSEPEKADLRERMLREARAIARVDHPNVVRVFDVFRDGGEPWIVMEYVRCRPLNRALAEDGAMAVAQVARIGLDLLAALAAAHGAGVMHRDVKPGNVLLADEGRVVLTDFGLATVHGDSGLTHAGLVMGSPAYVAPERAHGDPARPESDLWSLGATLYAAVEGRPPYSRSSAMATLAALATELPPAPRHAGALLPVLEGLLRRDPAERISLAEAGSLMRQALGGAATPGVAGARAGAGGSGRDAVTDSDDHRGATQTWAATPPALAATEDTLRAAAPAADGCAAADKGSTPDGHTVTGPPVRRLSRWASIGTALGVLVLVVVAAGAVPLLGWFVSAETEPVAIAPSWQVPAVVSAEPAVPSANSTPVASASPSPSPSARRSRSASPAASRTRAVAASSPASITPVVSGRIIVNVGTSKCLGIPGSDPATTLPIHIWECDGTPGTSYTLPGDGRVQAVGGCLQVDDTAAGSNLHLAACDGGWKQRFSLNGSGDLVNVRANRCVEVTDGRNDNGTLLRLADCNGSVPQKWYIG
ncbi:protein kinase domain-containing protein [Catenuloplanes atrovinosus]